MGEMQQRVVEEKHLAFVQLVGEFGEGPHRQQDADEQQQQAQAVAPQEGRTETRFLDDRRAGLLRPERGFHSAVRRRRR